MTLKTRMWRPHEVASDRKSKLTTCIEDPLLSSPASGPVRRFLRASEALSPPESTYTLPIERRSIRSWLLKQVPP